MSDKSKQAAQPQEQPSTESYLDHGNLEAHIIADMLRIEQITNELKEFKESTNREMKDLKDNTNKRFDKVEGWIIKGLGVGLATLIAVLFNIVFKL